MKSLLLLLTAGIATTQPAPGRGLRIVIRETRPPYVSETIEHLQGGKKREELRLLSRMEQFPDGPLVPTDQSNHVAITRCDLQRFVTLNPRERTYVSHPLEWRPSALQGWLVRMTYRKSEPARTPNLLIETTTVDTGERKHAFGLVARRVITTRKEIPLPSRGVARDGTTIDGWYVDLDPEVLCEPPRYKHAYLHGSVLVNGISRTPPPIVTFKDVGKPEEGYPIELKTTYPHGDWQVAGGTYRTEQVVTELSSELLDPILFEIPKGFRPAEGRFASLAGNLYQTWRLFRGAVASYF